ncbi:MAG TPA: hypothetical protein VGM98_22325 [Schlesneria sp.]|jgi:hypothetical protein
MRQTKKFSVRLLTIIAICASLMFVICKPVWTQETKKSTSRIKELQQQRLAILEEAREIATKLYRSARIDFDAVYAVERELFIARTTSAETQKERIDACDEAIKHAAEWRQIVETRKEFARSTEISALKSQAFTLEVQIAREKLAPAE